jgi:uncharacterized protein HemX
MAPHPHHAKRASVQLSSTADIVLSVLLLVAAIFIIGVVLLICKRKRARKQRQRKLVQQQESRPFVAPEPQPVAAQESQPFMAQEYRMEQPQQAEMPADPRAPIELQGGVVDDASRREPQQIDGFVAPATAAHDARPVEMAAQSVAR